ncbi:MAG: hypothetical protein DRO40_05350 [Thermoprotei archaeon]|nr:MAG: hypothetical protein DRO40_05350 [Thermoprotei archaeon]
MEMVVARYIYWFILFLLILVANISPDRRRRLSRILRSIAYLSIWVPLILGVLQIDYLQVFFVTLCSIACLAISLYSEGYLRILFGRIAPLQFIIDSTLVLLVMFFTAYNLIELVVLWISIEILGFILILIERGIGNWNIATKYLILCATTGDISLFTWLAVVSLNLGIEKGLLAGFNELAFMGISVNPFVTFLLLIGFTTKLGQIPLHFWLVDTYSEAPSVSTAIFSGLMSKMAVYGILRLYYTISLDINIFMYLLLIQGLITAIYGFLMTSAQTDVKKLLAYSSMGHYGVMTMFMSFLPVLGEVALVIMYIYVLYHGIVKTQVFLNTGSIELLANTREIYRLGYLSRIAKETYFSVVLGFLSLIGIPPTLGFLIKFLIVAIAFQLLTYGEFYSFALLIGVVFLSIFSIVYAIKYLSVYTGSYTGEAYRPVISLEDTQLISERMLALSLLIVPVIPLIKLALPYNLVIAIIYVLGLLVLIVSLLMYRSAFIREADVWLGGVEA